MSNTFQISFTGHVADLKCRIMHPLIQRREKSTIFALRFATFRSFLALVFLLALQAVLPISQKHIANDVADKIQDARNLCFYSLLHRRTKPTPTGFSCRRQTQSQFYNQSKGSLFSSMYYHPCMSYFIHACCTYQCLIMISCLLPQQ